MSEHTHHAYCKSPEKHTGVCRDAMGEPLQQIRQDERDRYENPQVLDSLRNEDPRQKAIRERISATGMPVGSIIAIERPHNYSVSPDGLPNNAETERYLRAVGMLKPHATQEGILEAVQIEGQKVSYHPDFPMLEMNYSEPNGLQIQMSVQVPDEMRKYYNSEMALNSLAFRMGTLIKDLNIARRISEEADQADAVITGEPTGE